MKYIEEIFKLDNIVLVTKAEDRAPTLYFQDKNTGLGCRLRQEHDNGAKVSPLRATIHFFGKEDDTLNFRNHFKDVFSSKIDGIDKIVHEAFFYDLKREALVGDHHIEIFIDKDGSSFRCHRSAGQVIDFKNSNDFYIDIDNSKQEVNDLTISYKVSEVINKKDC
ncbi:hypothetical protein [Francisella sp. SYW-2]|uniref:hypothetical protein n=1 Tax=Francisella sp. SYW-2 TaxID=2610886 RepID=UPI00123DBD6F|nr:hypothetical protein [Francisella sp. SYW-2]